MENFIFDSAAGRNRFDELMEDPYLASRAYNQIENMVQEFEAELDREHEVLLQVVTVGGAAMRVESVGYINPNLLVFHGTVGGNAGTALLHLHQLSFLMTAAQVDGSRSKRIPGFVGSANGAF